MLLRTRDDLHRCVTPGIRDADDGDGGKSSSSGDDGRRSNDASTSHVPSSDEHATNSGSSPSTKDYAKRTMTIPKTSRRCKDGKRKQAR